MENLPSPKLTRKLIEGPYMEDNNLIWGPLHFHVNLEECMASVLGITDHSYGLGYILQIWVLGRLGLGLR